MSDGIDAMEFRPLREFDCPECGRHLIVVCGPEVLTICAACHTMPGWHRDPEMRRIIEEGPRGPRS